MGHFSQGRAKLDGNLAHPFQVSILLSLQVLLLCLQLLYIRKKVPLDDCLEALIGEIRTKIRDAIWGLLPFSPPILMLRQLLNPTPQSIQPNDPQSLGAFSKEDDIL